MNEEEKIKNIEEILELCREELPYNEDISATLDCEDLESLECLYNLYNQEKEKNKKLEKVIDVMAEELPINAEICDKLKDSKNDCYVDIVDEKACSSCIKEYYFKKAGGEENDK